MFSARYLAQERIGAYRSLDKLIIPIAQHGKEVELWKTFDDIVLLSIVKTAAVLKRKGVFKGCHYWNSRVH